MAAFGGAAAWPIAARGQRAMPVIGYLHPSSATVDISEQLRGFRQGLKEVGYIEGENVAIEFRHADNQLDRLHALAAQLESRHGP
jgi:putative ABC transport system substrate-binding protein